MRVWFCPTAQPFAVSFTFFFYYFLKTGFLFIYLFILWENTLIFQQYENAFNVSDNLFLAFTVINILV